MWIYWGLQSLCIVCNFPRSFCLSIKVCTQTVLNSDSVWHLVSSFWQGVVVFVNTFMRSNPRLAVWLPYFSKYIINALTSRWHDIRERVRRAIFLSIHLSLFHTRNWKLYWFFYSEQWTWTPLKPWWLIFDPKRGLLKKQKCVFNVWQASEYRGMLVQRGLKFIPDKSRSC